MVDSLIFIESFIKVGLAARAGPKKIPLVRFCESKSVGFAQRTDKFCVSLKDFVEHLAVVDVVASPLVSVSRCWRSVHQNLGGSDYFEVYCFVY